MAGDIAINISLPFFLTCVDFCVSKVDICSQRAFNALRRSHRTSTCITRASIYGQQ